MAELINKAKSAIGRGDTPDPKAELARNKLEAEGELKNLLKKEEKLKAQVEMYRENAKEALRTGNTRAYDINNAQYKRASGGLKMASAAVDSARNMIGLMDSQESVGSIMEMSKTVTKMQASMGIKPEEMKEAAFNIRESISQTEAVSDAMSSISDMVTGVDDIEVGDPLKAELMAEIQSESAVNGFGKEIEAKMKELEE